MGGLGPAGAEESGAEASGALPERRSWPAGSSKPDFVSAGCVVLELAVLRGAAWACRIMSSVESDCLKGKFLVKTLKLFERSYCCILTGVNAALPSRALVSRFVISLR